MILETIVSTIDRGGRVNFAPMGITLEGAQVTLRPFRTAVTWKNLQEVGEGVINVTDDVLLFARCALGPHVPPHHRAVEVHGHVLDAACSWKEFVVDSKDVAQERAVFAARVVHEGRLRDFLGYNRARHAVIEATILATRLHLLGRDRVLEEMTRLRPLLDKTGGEAERLAWTLIETHAREWRDAG